MTSNHPTKDRTAIWIAAINAAALILVAVIERWL